MSNDKKRYVVKAASEMREGEHHVNATTTPREAADIAGRLNMGTADDADAADWYWTEKDSEHWKFAIVDAQRASFLDFKPRGDSPRLTAQEAMIHVALVAGITDPRSGVSCEQIVDAVADMAANRKWLLEEHIPSLTKRMAVSPGYEQLATTLDAALEQAQAGKGKERHHTEGVPYHEQPAVTICRSLGSNHFAIGQAIKKARESARLPPDRARLELLGAINYLAAAYLALEDKP